MTTSFHYGKHDTILAAYSLLSLQRTRYAPFSERSISCSRIRLCRKRACGNGSKASASARGCAASRLPWWKPSSRCWGNRKQRSPSMPRNCQIVKLSGYAFGIGKFKATVTYPIDFQTFQLIQQPIYRTRTHAATFANFHGFGTGEAGIFPYTSSENWSVCLRSSSPAS